MPSRRAFIMGSLATSAGLSPAARAQTSSARTSDDNEAPRTILQLQRRTIEVNGKPASVFGIRQPDSTVGVRTAVGQPFHVRVENRIDQPSLIHWHGLTPPWQQDGVPGVSGPPSRPAAAPTMTSRCASAARSGCTPIRACKSSCSWPRR
jgi:FtsP/CotA-like multicopper oxidase with cupredoxin domain